MKFTQNDLTLGKVLDEDEDFMLVKLIKKATTQIPLNEGDRFHMFAFVRFNEDTEQAEIWKPWEESPVEIPKPKLIRVNPDV